MSKEFKITKPVRMIELFAGYGSQYQALRRLRQNCESYKISEWCIPSNSSYKAMLEVVDNKYDTIDYSKKYSDEEIINRLIRLGLSVDSGFTEIDKDTIEPVIKPVIDKKKEVLIKVHSELIDLVDSTTNEELAALCNACDYDYDALIDYAKKYKEFFIGKDSPEEIDEIDR